MTSRMLTDTAAKLVEHYWFHCLSCPDLLDEFFRWILSAAVAFVTCETSCFIHCEAVDEYFTRCQLRVSCTAKRRWRNKARRIRIRTMSPRHRMDSRPTELPARKCSENYLYFLYFSPKTNRIFRGCLSKKVLKISRPLFINCMTFFKSLCIHSTNQTLYFILFACSVVCAISNTL